jgi:RNA recognition motif-containing protein
VWHTGETQGFDAEKEYRIDIYVGNLASDITENDLREAFELFGRVETAGVAKHHHSGASRGFGFVGMPSRGEAASAVVGLHGRSLKGQAITTTELKPRDPVSGVCRTRCPHCGREQAAKNAHTISSRPWREEEGNGTGKNNSK